MKTETKHTPGPWTVQRLMDNWRGCPEWSTFCVRRVDNVHLATIGDMDRYGCEHNEANARLIAAAPELLEALQALLPYLTTQEDLLNHASLNEGRASGFDIASVKARAAIAKATKGGK